jgi:uncharacterized protein YceH (UPF0502 family)
MEIKLDDTEIRILASLIEKQITTPAYYPLTLKALMAACNQKSNRYPVVAFNEETVERGVERLQKRGLAETIYKADSRVPKYQHLFTEKHSFSNVEVAVLCELMLRGGQTFGELHSRAARMYSFRGIDEVAEIINGLSGLEEPVATRLPRQPGRKEHRYTHLFSVSADLEIENVDIGLKPASNQIVEDKKRILRLEKKVELISEELESLKKAFKDLT